MRTFLSLLLLIATLAYAMPVFAAAPGFAEGVRAYNTRQYRQALTYFQQAARVAPTDPLIHYYLGLSYQGINQMTLAKQEYAYVAQSSNRQIAAQASTALTNLSSYRTAYSGSGHSGSASSSTALASSIQPSSGSSSSPVKISGRLQILYFTADW
jgi:tetratricopeptide (TPR) repeat protein